MPNDSLQRLTPPTNSAPPPPLRRAPAKRIAIAGSGVLFAGLILIVAFNIDFGAGKVNPDIDETEIVDIRPSFDRIDQQKLNDIGSKNFLDNGNLEAKLPRGSWIQKVDSDTGKLAQQYRFQDWDPNPQGKPDGWIRMQQPEAEVFLSDNKILTLSGDSALAFAPNHKLESGTLSGNVTIRLFTPGEDGELPDPNKDKPALIIHTADAVFDNFIGEINCIGDVQIETPTMALSNGSDLKVLIDDKNETVKLTMRRARQIRIAASSQPREEPIAQEPIAQSIPGTNSAKPTVVKPQAKPKEKPAQGSSKKPVQTTNNTTFYRLTLSENVRIHQGNRTASGDALSLVFSSKSKGMSQMLSSSFPMGSSKHLAQRRDIYFDQPMPPITALVTLPFSAIPQQDDLDEKSLGLAPPHSIDDLIIDCDGPLTIVPVTEQSEKLESAEDALLTLTAEGKPVYLTDISEDSEAQCDHLLYHTNNQRLELVGSDLHQLWLRSPQFLASGKKFWFEPQANRAGFDGSGNLMVNRAQQTGAVTFVGPKSVVIAMAALGFNAAPLNNNQDSQSVNVAWNDNMQMYFTSPNDENQTNRLSSASFMGDVDVRSTSFNLNSQTMLVRFSDDNPTADNHIQSISATGNVHAISKNDAPGEIECDLFDLTLAQSVLQKTIPLHFRAKGDVKTSDPQQTLWSNEINVSFEEITSVDTNELQGESQAFQITDMLAENDIEIRLNGGARILADNIQSNGATQTAVISGENLKIIQENLLINGAKELQLDGNKGQGVMPGAGNLRVFPDNIPLEYSPNGRTIRVLDDFAAPELDLNWDSAASFDEAHDNGSGAIEFQGNVIAVADPSPFEHDNLVSNHLRIEFYHDTASDQDSKRSIGKLIATGNAKLENRAWELEDHSDTPRVFYIDCNYLEFDNKTGEALADGAGKMLIRDERPQAKTADENQDSSNRFGTSGTTSFLWTQHMQMERIGKDLFDISMQDSVEVRYLNIKGEKATMSANQLLATIYRPRKTSKTDGDKTGLDTGGPAELMRVQAIGRVFLRTTTRDVECEHFDYDVKTGIAILRAKPGNRVSVLARGTVQPFRAEQIIWDMKKDTLRVVRATGGGGR